VIVGRKTKREKKTTRSMCVFPYQSSFNVWIY